MKCLACGALAMVLASPATAMAANGDAALAAKSAAASAQAAFMTSCPLTDQAEAASTTKSGLLAGIIVSVVKDAFTSVADKISQWAEKENNKLNAVVTYSGYSNFYLGQARKAPACLVVVRFPQTRTEAGAPIAAEIGKRRAAFAAAGFTVTGGPTGEHRGAPDFYAEFKLVPTLEVSNAKNETGYAAFTLVPGYVYYGASAAKEPKEKPRKSLRAEIEFTRLKLETGAYADKPYFSAGFDLTKGMGLKEDRLDVRSDLLPAVLAAVPPAPPAAYPAPAELKSAAAYTNGRDLIGGQLLDRAATRIQVKVVEAEEPSFIMKWLAEVSAENKDKIKDAADSAASKVATAIENAINK